MGESFPVILGCRCAIRNSLPHAVGSDMKGKFSLSIYLLAIPLDFVSPLDCDRALRFGGNDMVHT
jgi:hypothetical protein